MSTTVYGNKKTKKYHSSQKNNQCRQGEILKANLVQFNSPEAAEAAGYTGCRSCYPVAAAE